MLNKWPILYMCRGSIDTAVDLDCSLLVVCCLFFFSWGIFSHEIDHHNFITIPNSKQTPKNTNKNKSIRCFCAMEKWSTGDRDTAREANQKRDNNKILKLIKIIILSLIWFLFSHFWFCFGFAFLSSKFQSNEFRIIINNRNFFQVIRSDRKNDCRDFYW